MKKIFTLIAVAAIALTANAQGTIQCTGATGDAVVAIPAIDYTNCSNLTVTINASTGVKIKANNGQESIWYGTTNFAQRWELQGDNAVDAGGQKYSQSGNVPTVGAFVKLEPTADGTIYFGCVLAASKVIQFTEDGNQINVEYYTTSYDDLEEVYSSSLAGTITSGSQLSAKTYCVVKIPVKANSVYYAFLEASKIGFAGLTYETSGSAVESITEAKSEAVAPAKKVVTANGIQIGNYNIAGQRVK